MSSVRTPDRQTADELRAVDAELKFKACLEAAVDAVVVIDENGLIEEFNNAAQRMFGYSFQEVAGLNVRVLMPSHDADRHDRYMAGYHETGTAKIIGIGREVKARRRDGSTFPVKLSVGEAVMPDGIRYVGVIHDLSEERATEDALRRSEAALQAAQEVARIGNFDLQIPGGRGEQVLAPQLMKILGLPVSLAEETAERLFGEMVHPDDRDRVRREIEAAADRGEKLDLQYRIQRPAGEVRTVQVMARVTRTVGRLRLVGVLHDITESRRAEEEARQARERLTHVGRLSTMGEMASGLAHELNQPLTAITAYAQAATRMCENEAAMDSGELRRILDSIASQALRAGNVIARMRDLVRNRQTEREVADCNSLVTSLVTLAEPDARAADVALRLELAEGLPPVEVDQVQIQQVLLNLVRNAIDATLAADGGVREILIRTRLNDSRDVEVSVADHGCGLPHTELEKLCTPFYTTKREGTGLGLSISMSILRAHGGTMNFANNPEGGATVTFTLPVKVDGQE